jgi:hypothetical protein
MLLKRPVDLWDNPMKYKIEEIEGIGPAYATKLIEAGIKTTGSLLKSCGDPNEIRVGQVIEIPN